MGLQGTARDMKAREFITKIPVPICGLALGLASLDLFLSQRYDPYAYRIFAVLAAIILSLFTLRMVFDRRGILKDIENPAIFGVLPTYTMTLMLLSAYAKDYIGDLALILWLGAIAASFFMMVIFVTRYFFKVDVNKVFPAWIIIFVGYVVASVTSPAFGMERLGQMIFWIGVTGYLTVIPLIIYRMLKVRKIPESLIPQIAIITAPVNLCISGCLTAFGDSPPETMLMILTVLGVISYVAVMLYLPVMLNRRFYPSYAALTFPLVISAASFYKLGVYFELSSDLFMILRDITAVAAVAIVVYVLIRYVIFLCQTAKSTGKANA